MTKRTRIKICGLKNLADALYAADRGADSIGLVFHAASPRYIELEQALEIRQSLPPFVTVTALLMDESKDWVGQVVHSLQPDCLQFHGSESADFCNTWNVPYIKTIAMASVNDPNSYAKSHSSAQGFLLDSNKIGQQGGSGETFDWTKIPSSLDFPLVLAGGLTPSNICAAIAQVKPWGVDVSSGVESSKAVKSQELIGQFFDQVKAADLNLAEGA